MSVVTRSSGRGGARPGAGRPRKGPRPIEPHSARVRFAAEHPLHVFLRAEPAVGDLRRPGGLAAARRALSLSLSREQFRICQLSIQTDHLHFLVEADDHVALARGMQGFTISFARQLNRALGADGTARRGPVFTERYHVVPLTSPRRVRDALLWVLNNWRHHRLDRPVDGPLDPFASGEYFDGWSEPVSRTRPDGEALPVALPTRPLLEQAWRRHRLISPFEVPRGVALDDDLD
jgi:putative transposase